MKKKLCAILHRDELEEEITNCLSGLVKSAFRQKRNLLTFLFLFLTMATFAQYRISGIITNSETGEPLPGANIVLQNTFLVTTSDADGVFSFNHVKQGKYTLVCSYVGFEKAVREIEITKDLRLEIALQPKVYLSEEVIISAVRAGGETGTNSVKLDGSVLERENMGKDLPFMMQSLPSTVVTSDAGNGVGYTGIRIRGTDITGINVTMNGVPVNDPESHAVFFVDLPDLVSSVDDIGVQRGVGSSSNGSASFGASINIKTGDLSVRPYGEFSSAAGSFNTFKNTLKLGSGLIDGKWAFDGRASFISSDGYIDRADAGLQSYYFSGGYYGKRDVFKVYVINGREKTYQVWYGTPKDSLETNRTYNPAGAIYNEEGELTGYYDNQTDNYIQTYYQAHYAHEFTRQLSLVATLFYTRGKGYYENYKNDKSFAGYGFNDTVIGTDTITHTDMITRKWLNNHFYGINLALNYSLKRVQLNFGAGWNNYDGDHYGRVIWAQVAPMGMYDKDWYFNNGLKQDYHFFAKADFRINDKLNLYADLQYRGINYKIEGTHDDLRDLTQEHQYNFFNPKLGLNYTVSQKHKLFVYAGIANREPSRSVFRDADPGQEVKPEMLMDYEAGYTFGSSQVSLETNLFYMDYKDQLVMTGKINNVGAPIMTNVPESYRAGIEFSGAVKFLKIVNWSLNATYSLNKIKDFTEYVDNWNYWDDPESQPYQYEKYLGTTDISFSPDLTMSSRLTVEPLKKFTIALLTQYVSRQYIDNTSSKERSLDPYLVNGLQLNYSLKTRFVKQIDFIFVVNNLFDAAYETNAWVYRYVYDGTEYEMNGYFPQAGINFTGGVSFRF